MPALWKTRLKQWVQALDVTLNEKPVDFRELLADPLEALNRANGYPVLVNVSGAICRGGKVLAFPLTQASAHPYIRTALEYKSGEASSFQESALNSYYQQFQPRNAAELYGISEAEAPPILLRNQRLMKLPWEGEPRAADVKARQRLPENEAKAHGLTLSWQEGDALFGPVSAQKGALEFSRIQKLVDAITSQGYWPQQHIPATLLIGEHGYRILLETGNHRAAVLAALDDQRIPLLLRPDSSISRRKAHQWPAVQKGAFSRETALRIFDRIFEGRQPEALAGTSYHSG